MHWLAEQVKNLHDLINRHRQYKELAAAKVAGSEQAEKQAREAFLAAVREFVEGIAGRDGVAACFASHEGLLVESAGDLDDFEALAAMAQGVIEAGVNASINLDLGDLRQMVIVGSKQKVALFWVGQIAVGILGAHDVQLAQLLS